MSIALRNKQMMIIALFILALVTVLVLTSVVFSAVAHVNIWHAIIPVSSKLLPNAMYGS
jgi:hypothetical protein